MIADDKDDEELAAAASAGEREAVEALLRRHHDRLHGLCRRMTGNEADAADATQEALIAIARGLAAGRFDGRARFGTWAHRVAVNACLDDMRRRERRPRALPDEALERELVDGGPALDASVADRVDVDVALGRLAVDFRAAVVLRDLCGLDYAEIATVLDLPPGTVRSRIARGRAALADLLRNPTGSGARPSQRP